MNSMLKARLILLIGAALGAAMSFVFSVPMVSGVAFGAAASVPVSMLLNNEQPWRQRLFLSAAVTLLIAVALLAFYFHQS